MNNRNATYCQRKITMYIIRLIDGNSRIFVLRYLFQIRIGIHRMGVGKKKKFDKQKQNIIMLSKRCGGVVGIKG